MRLANSLAVAAVASCGLLEPMQSAVADGYTFTTVNVPGATATAVTGINDSGLAVGYFRVEAGNTHSFFDANGTLTQLRDPNSVSTMAQDINNAASVIGTFTSNANTSALPQGFLDISGVFTTTNFPGYAITDPFGNNNKNQIVGAVLRYSAGARTTAFLESSGVFSTIAVPGSSKDAALGINDQGVIVGTYFDLFGKEHGFLDNGGTFETIDVPGAKATLAYKINDNGEIVGTFEDSAGTLHGFRDVNDTFMPIDVNGAASTEIFGLDSQGQITGAYFNATGEHGFIGSPNGNGRKVAEPTTMALVGFGLANLFFSRRRRA
jgi:probable HAF family extracellular repeat protein